MEEVHHPALVAVSCISAFGSTAFQGIALCSPWWTYFRQTFNSTFNRYVNMGLFVFCETADNNITVRVQCHHSWSHPELFRAGETQVMRNAAVSAPIFSFVLASIATSWSYILSKRCKDCHHGNLVISVLFVLSGILSLTGFIAYANHINDLISSRKQEVKEKSNVDEPFDFSYGASIFLLGLSVVLSEISGGLNTALFLNYYRSAYMMPLRCAPEQMFRCEGSREREDKHTCTIVAAPPELQENAQRPRVFSLERIDRRVRVQPDSSTNVVKRCEWTDHRDECDSADDDDIDKARRKADSHRKHRSQKSTVCQHISVV